MIRGSRRSVAARSTRRIVTSRSVVVALAVAASLVVAPAFERRASAQTPTPVPTSAPVPAPAPVPSPVAPPSAPSAPTGASPAPPSAAPAVATPEPTPPPIIVDPPSAGVALGTTLTLHVMQVLGNVTVAVADPSIADAGIDQSTREIALVGKKVGTTTLVVRDGRGLERTVAVRVAELAGDIPSDVSLRVTGRPASTEFLREQALAAAVARVVPRAGARIVATPESVDVRDALRVDDLATIDVPIIISGDAYFTVQGTTHVHVENFAQPRIRPRSLLVSDFPETLKENGILFNADLDARSTDRFLYYHYNPPEQPDRRIVLDVQNPSSQPALVQYISGIAGPGTNEMEVGHLATQRFLVREAQNEGTVVTIPGNATVSLMSQALPSRQTASGIMQLHEIEGAPLHLTLVAQNATDPVDGPIPNSALLVGDRPHARGVYSIPEFFFDYSYDAEGPNLEMPIGQIPLPNLMRGQTLAGDYGVEQSLTVRMVNNDRHNAREIALYASPRGGRATGTFVIDRVLVQAHAMPPYGHYKLRQYSIPPGSFVRTEIVTMPEGGSSYPLRLIVAPDDGSAPPGAADSPIY